MYFLKDPLALSYPLTNINGGILVVDYVQYGSNLIMSFRVKIQRMIILFGGILVNFFVLFRGTKVSAKTSAPWRHMYKENN